MYDQEANNAVAEELRKIHTTFRRFVVYIVFITMLPFVGVLYVAHEFRELDRRMKAEFDQELSQRLRQTNDTLNESNIALRRSLDKLLNSLGQQTAAKPHSSYKPPRFPEGTKFVPDLTSPNGYRAVNEGTPGKK
ncbi:MAG: hypothetical protein OJI67_06610 [Prosthecobacter sp.]|nr:hypothetical protein [Prosthecobacter sp.]